jgi:hypothetical protein
LHTVLDRLSENLPVKPNIHSGFIAFNASLMKDFTSAEFFSSDVLKDPVESLLEGATRSGSGNSLMVDQ